MNRIPPKLRRALSEDPYMKRCARSEEGACHGRVTWEHALMQGGRQLQRAWAIVPLCWNCHLGPGLNKELNRHLAFQRANPEDFDEFPRSADAWRQEAEYLKKKYARN